MTCMDIKILNLNFVIFCESLGRKKKKSLIRGTNDVNVLPVRAWGAPQVSQGSAGHLEGQPGRRGVEAPRKTRPRLECWGRWGSLRSLADWNILNRLRDIGNKKVYHQFTG